MPDSPASARGIAHRALFGAALAAATLLAHAQPETVRLWVGYTAGGPVDAAARLFAQAFGKASGTTVIVENKPGAGGSIAADAVAKSPGSGQVLSFAASPTLTITPHLQKISGFDPVSNLIPIAPILSYTTVLVVGRQQPFSSVSELLAHGRAQSGTITYGSAGVGTQNHLSGELLAQRCGVSMRHIPYKGNAPAMSDVIGGQVTMMFDIIGNARGHIAGGRVRPLAVTSSQRNAALPDVPTLQQAGVADFDVGGWFGLFGPTSLPADLVERYNDAARKALATPELRARLVEGGHDVWSATPQALGARTADEYRLWGEVTRRLRFE